MESLPDWSALDSDLLVEIAVRVPLIEDFMAFIGVCSSWRAVARRKKLKPFQANVPLLMLPEKRNDNGVRDFYSPSKRKVCMRLPLPEAKFKICIEARFGWLVTVASSGGVSLLNPFSRAEIELPNLETIPSYKPQSLHMFRCFARAVLSANPSDTSDFVLMVIFHWSWNLGFWKVGDRCWTEIKPPGLTIREIAYYNEKLYAVAKNSGALWVWDPFGPNRDLTMLFQVGNPSEFGFLVNVHLVESTNGELLLLTSHNKHGKTVVRIKRLDIMKCVEEQVAGLGNDAIFVGKNACVSVAASAFPDFVKPNCIYFTKGGHDDWPGTMELLDAEGKKMGICSIENGRTEWLLCGDPATEHPVWVAPILH